MGTNDLATLTHRADTPFFDPSNVCSGRLAASGCGHFSSDAALVVRPPLARSGPQRASPPNRRPNHDVVAPPGPTRHHVRMPQPLPTPEPLYDAVGRVAVEWAEHEVELGALLVALLHTPTAELLAAGQPYSVVHSHIKAIITQWEVIEPPITDMQLSWLESVLADSSRLSDRRNRIVHGSWLRTATELEWVSLRPRRHHPLLSREILTVKQIHLVAQEIATLSAQIRRLGAHIDFELYGHLFRPRLDDEPGS